MSHQDKNELSKEELAAKGVEGDEMSLLANVGIFVAIAGTAVFVAIAGIVVWNFMADALTREISGKTTQRKASMLEDGIHSFPTRRSSDLTLFPERASCRERV